MPYDDENKYKDIVLVAEETREYLNPRQEMLEEQRKTRRLQERIVLDKARDAVQSV